MQRLIHIMAVGCLVYALCTSGCTSSVVTYAKTIYFTALPSFTVCPSQARRSLACTSPIACLTRSFLRGETGDQTAATKRGNAEPLQAAKTAKSSQNSVSNIDINTDVHTQTLPVSCTSTHSLTHTGTLLSFLSIITFVLADDCADCLLLWSWPSR